MEPGEDARLRFSGVYDFSTTVESGGGSPVAGVLEIGGVSPETDRFTGTLLYRFIETPNYGGEDDLEVNGTIQPHGRLSFKITGGPERDWTVSGEYNEASIQGEYVLRGGDPVGSIVYRGRFSAEKR